MSAERAMQHVAAMETDVRDIERWADLLIIVGNNPDEIPQEIVRLIGYSLARIGDDVKRRWGKAFEELGGTP